MQHTIYYRKPVSKDASVEVLENVNKKNIIGFHVHS